MTIELEDFLDKNKSVALIVEAPTGVKYATVCDGVRSDVKKIEGFILPLPKFDTTKYPLFCASWWYINHNQGPFSWSSYKDYIIKNLEEALNSDRMAHTRAHNFKITEVKDCYEAWVHLEFDLDVVKDDEPTYKVETCRMKGILTWANSE